MDSYIVHPEYRVESEVKFWDSKNQQWVSKKLDKPKVVKRYPAEVLAFYRELLLRQGYSEIEETEFELDLMNQLWTLCDKYNEGRIGWNELEDKIIDWYLKTSERLKNELR